MELGLQPHVCGRRLDEERALDVGRSSDRERDAGQRQLFPSEPRDAELLIQDAARVGWGEVERGRPARGDLPGLVGHGVGPAAAVEAVQGEQSPVRRLVGLDPEELVFGLGDQLGNQIDQRVDLGASGARPAADAHAGSEAAGALVTAPRHETVFQGGQEDG